MGSNKEIRSGVTSDVCFLRAIADKEDHKYNDIRGKLGIIYLIVNR